MNPASVRRAITTLKKQGVITNSFLSSFEEGRACLVVTVPVDLTMPKRKTKPKRK